MRSACSAACSGPCPSTGRQRSLEPTTARRETATPRPPSSSSPAPRGLQESGSDVSRQEVLQNGLSVELCLYNILNIHHSSESETLRQPVEDILSLTCVHRDGGSTPLSRRSLRVLLLVAVRGRSFREVQTHHLHTDRQTDRQVRNRHTGEGQTGV